MNPARLSVRAVMVSDGRARGLGAALDALLAQDPAPDTVHLLLTRDVEPPAGSWPARVDVRRVQAQSFGDAVQSLLAEVPASANELLWLLHDDIAPLPGALAALTATARKRRRGGVIGAAQVRWDDPTRLVSLGTTTTRVGARRIPLVEDHDVNQGQYDDREDVLAVSLGGALVRREVWEQLDGVDPALEGWSESLNFCRRVWRAGYDVVAEPAARVRHSQEKLYGRRGGFGGGRRSTYAARRASEWYHAATFAPLWALPALMVWTWISAAGRTVLRIAQNEPRLIAADFLVPWRLLFQMVRLYGSRRRVRRAGKVGKAAERRLLAGPREVFRHVRAREWGTRAQRAAAAAPTDVIRAELAVARGRRRLTLGALVLVLAGVSVVLHPTWLTGLAGGNMLTGSTLGITDVGLGELWSRASSGWSTQSLGAPAIDAGLSGLLLPLAAIPGGLPVGLGLVLLFLPLLAGLSAWAAAGAFTRSLVARTLAAIIYALWPTALLAAEQGRVGAVVVHIALPWAVMALTRAGGWQRGERIGDGEEFPQRPLPSASAGMGAAVMFGIVVIAAPALLLPTLVVIGVVGALAGKRRWRIWGIAIPAVVVSMPGLIAAAQASGSDALAILLREPGPSASAPLQSAVDLLTGLQGQGAGVPDVLLTAGRGMVALVVLGAGALALVGRRRGLAALALVTAAGGLALAVAAQGVTLSPALGAGGAAAAGWYGTGMSVVAIALLVVWCATLADVWLSGAGARRAWRRVAALVLALTLSVAAGAAAAAQLWPTREAGGDVVTSAREVLPLVAAIEQETDAKQRVLALTKDGPDIEFAVLASDGIDVLTSAGTLVADGSPAWRAQAPPVASAATLGPAVAGLTTGDDEAVTALSRWGIGVVVAAPGSEVMAESLAQTTSLQLMGASERGTAWRIGPSEPDTRVANAWLEQSSDAPLEQRIPARVSASAGTVQAPGAGTLVIAHTADPRWTAAVDGRPLARADDEFGRQAFTVPQAGTVTYAYDDRGYRLWFWASVIVLGWAAIGAIPARSRRAILEEQQ